jgi:hypothetical protein
MHTHLPVVGSSVGASLGAVVGYRVGASVGITVGNSDGAGGGPEDHEPLPPLRPLRSGLVSIRPSVDRSPCPLWSRRQEGVAPSHSPYGPTHSSRRSVGPHIHTSLSAIVWAARDCGTKSFGLWP